MSDLLAVSEVIRWALPGVSWSGTFLWCAVFTVFSGWYAGMETALYRFNRLRGQLLARSGHRRAQQLEKYLDDQRLLICVFLIGTNLSHYLAATSAVAYLTAHGRSGHEAELVSTLTLTPILFIFGETIPKNWFYLRANTLLLRSKRIIAVSSWIVKATGLAWILQRVTGALMHLAGRLASERELASDASDMSHLLRESHAAGAISSVQTGIAERILELPEVSVLRLMIPIKRVIALPTDVSRDAFFESVREHRFEHIPLYESDRDNVVSVVNIDRVISNTESRPEDFAKPVLKLATDASLFQALNAMSRHATRTAVIVSARDRAVGILTMSDLIEYLLEQ